MKAAPIDSLNQSRNKPAISSRYRVRFKRLADPLWYRSLVWIYALIGLPYLIWRVGVANWGFWTGPLMLVADSFAIGMGLLHFWMIRDIHLPIYHPTKLDKKVDIFIPTFNESREVLEPVLVGATQVIGRRKVWVLDDGNRDWVQALAAELGCMYLARTTNEHAKAGNMNNGLAHSDADYIMTLDADHIPKPQFLIRTLGYFDDSRVGFVQTPQTFYNTDCFLFRRRWGGRSWSEQQLFYDVIQPAKNRWNSAFFVGTSALLRRAAIDSVGGFATGTATEDIHTSLRIHAAGWHSVFVPEVLALGLEAESLKEYYKQRRRWAAGSLGLLFRSPDSPLRIKGLSWQQRLNYLNATLSHVTGVQKMLYLVIPIVTLVTLQSPVVISNTGFLWIMLGNMLMAMLIARLYGRRAYHGVHNEAYTAANLLAHIAGLWGIIVVQRKFAVSRKRIAKNEQSWQKVILWSLALTSLAASIYSFARYNLGNHSGLIITSGLFAGLNAAYLLSFLVFLRRYEHRGVTSQIPDSAMPNAFANIPVMVHDEPSNPIVKKRPVKIRQS
jgi:cellulose synthase/poly-beta-1,6-N-acetylglucosamine synthase-like glycosyltransferase